MNRLFIFIISLPTIFIFSIPCNINDFKQILSSCDLNTNKRNILITKHSNCEIEKNYEQNNKLSIYSTLPEFKISCDLNCKSGEILNFNPILKEVECIKCPNNTFNTGNNLIINNWNNQILNEFEINCFSINKNEKIKNDYCTSIKINADKSIIMTGDLINDHYNKYYIQIIYFFNTKQPGNFSIKFKYDSINENNEINGELKLYFDYKLMLIEKNNNWQVIKKDFEKGNHEILISYFFKKVKDKNLRLYISDFEIFGLENLKCNKCINSVSPEGSDKCYFCSQNFFYNLTSHKCEECSKDKFSLPDSSSCINKEKCSNYDIELIEIEKCNNGKRNLKYYINENYCINNPNLKLNEEVPCLLNNKSQNELKCEKDKIFISKFNYDFKSILLNDFFNIVEGFYSNGNEIYSGLYNGNIRERLIKYFKTITLTPSIEIDLILNLEEDENFIIKINNEIKSSYKSISKSFNEKIMLPTGNIKLSFIYSKTSSLLKKKNGVIIKKLIIYGSDIENSENILEKCGEGYFSSKDCNSCYKITECSPYTYYEDNKCILNDVLIQKNEKIRINIKPFKDYYNILCNEKNGILCYENSFFKINYSHLNYNDLFFISLFNQSTLNISNEYKYNNNKNYFKNGQIFGLFTQITKINSFSFPEINLPYIKKNLGQNLTKVYLAENKGFNSIILEMENGDYCLSNLNKRYKSYINLKCNKNDISLPILSKILDDECTYIFEWNSPFFCRNCLFKDLKFIFQSNCINNQKEIFFEENDNCLIFNIINDDLYGFDKIENEEILDFNSQLYKIIFDNDNSKNKELITEEKNLNKQFDEFDYVINKSINEKCNIFNSNSSLKKYIIIIPLIYIITFLILIILYYKYKRKSDTYFRLDQMNNVIDYDEY
jgi:hypothetical protein